MGYQGDDGCIYEESRKYSTEHKFGPGNTVGCGIDYFNENFFFTLDGKLVGTSLAKTSTLLNERYVN